MKSVNFNVKIRNGIHQIYLQCQQEEKKQEMCDNGFDLECATLIRFQERIQELEFEYPTLYNYIVGLAFVDYYRITQFLQSKKGNQNKVKTIDQELVEEEQEQKKIEEQEIFEQVENIEDLKYLLESQPDYLLKILRISNDLVDYQENQRRALLSIEIPEQMQSLAPFHVFEMNELYSDITIFELCSDYRFYQILEDIYDDPHFTGVEHVVELLKCQMKWNPLNFVELIMKMLPDSYAFSKNYEMTKLPYYDWLVGDIIYFCENEDENKLLEQLMNYEPLLFGFVSSYFHGIFNHENVEMISLDNIIEGLSSDKKQKIKKKLYFNKV